MRIAALLLAGVFGGVILAAQSPSVERRDPAVEALAAEAVALPPEFAADILLRLAALPGIGPAWRHQLVDDAFVEAYAAPDPMRVQMPPFVPLDSRQAARVRAAQAGLDRVSLGSRAALMMASIDPDRGRELFETIDFDRAVPACGDALVPDVDLYYRAAAQIARRRYPPGGREAHDALAFFGYYVWRARLASELPAVLDAIHRFRPSRDETLFLDSVLRVILDRGVRDPRGLSIAGADFVRRVGNLVGDERELAIGPAPLLAAVRKYLAGQLAERCGDSVSPTIVPAAFNRMLIDRSTDADNIEPLPLDQTATARVLEPVRVDGYWRHGDAAAFRRRLQDLIGPDTRPLTVAERLQREWQERALMFLHDLERWDGPRGEDEADRFYQKQMIAGRLAEVAPTLDLQQRAIGVLMEGQRHAVPSRAWRAVWFVPESAAMELAREHRELLGLLEQSGEPVLALYARLERLTPMIGRRAD